MLLAVLRGHLTVTAGTRLLGCNVNVGGRLRRRDALAIRIAARKLGLPASGGLCEESIGTFTSSTSIT